MKTHTVQAGDTLSQLALRYYGNANGWRILFDANASIIMAERNRYEVRRKLEGNPWHWVFPGTVLTIPESAR